MEEILKSIQENFPEKEKEMEFDIEKFKLTIYKCGERIRLKTLVIKQLGNTTLFLNLKPVESDVKVCLFSSEEWKIEFSPKTKTNPEKPEDVLVITNKEENEFGIFYEADDKKEAAESSLKTLQEIMNQVLNN